MRVIEPEPCERETLEPRPTGAKYLDVLHAAATGDFDPEMLRHGLGLEECPLFTGLWDYCLESGGASPRPPPRRSSRTGPRVVFSPAGGMHHAMPNEAGGFCYVNDVAIACHIAAEHGFKVAYLDVDAHHGNGVQDIFWSDPRVLVTSLHETGRTLYPWGGFAEEIGEGDGRGYNLNLPLEPDTDDHTFLWAYREGIRPVIKAFAPDIIVVEMGADGLSSDPLTHLRYTNNGLADIAADLKNLAPRILVTGGGGYDMRATVKAWSLVWSVLNDIEPVNDAFAMLGGVFLGEESILDGSLRDMNVYLSGADRVRVQEAAERSVQVLHDKVFPIHGLRP